MVAASTRSARICATKSAAARCARLSASSPRGATKVPLRPRVSSGLHRDLRSLERPEGPREVQQAIKTETEQAFVFSGFYGADESNLADTRALTVATMILSTRMLKVIREQEQLVYGIRASSQPGTTYPGFGIVSAAAPTDPAKVDRLVKKIPHASRSALM